jgi:hypothetical protein
MKSCNKENTANAILKTGEDLGTGFLIKSFHHSLVWGVDAVMSVSRHGGKRGRCRVMP